MKSNNTAVTQSTSSHLASLACIISDGVQTIDSAYERRGIQFPSLDKPFKAGPLDNDAALQMTIQTVVAAAFQLIATVTPPAESLRSFSNGMYLSATLGTANEACIANILSNASSDGLAAEDIAKEVGIDSAYIARILRFLAARYVFTEVRPNVFANNRLSSLLVKPSTLSAIHENPVSQFDGAPMAASVGHVTDEAFKSSVFLSSYVSGGHKHSKSPFNMAMGTKANMWEWFQEPGNELRARRFNTGIKGWGERFPASIYADAFCWQSLERGAVVVDVGGGVGPVTLALHRDFPDIKFVVQDLESVVVDAKKFWEKEDPAALTNGHVKLQVQNFFEAQAVRNAAVYILRLILHDWPQSECRTILTRLRQAANQKSKLIIFDMVVLHTCAGATPDAFETPPAPFPLLANFSAVPMVTLSDIDMLCLFGALERTVKDFTELADATGWKLESMKPGSLTSLVFAAV